MPPTHPRVIGREDAISASQQEVTNGANVTGRGTSRAAADVRSATGTSGSLRGRPLRAPGCGQPTQTRFFADERASRQGITLTDHLLGLANGQEAKVLPREVDARWNLVQMSRVCARVSGWCRSRWPRIKKPWTYTRPPACAAVTADHVLPFVLMTRGWQDCDLHQIWNLVLACYACNSEKRRLVLQPWIGTDADLSIGGRRLHR